MFHMQETTLTFLVFKKPVHNAVKLFSCYYHVLAYYYVLWVLSIQTRIN